MLFIKNTIETLKKHPTLVKITIFALLYFFIRCGWQGSIEFGYDPARLSQMIVDILDKHDLGNAPQYILDNISIGAVAWGPMFIYVMIPFFLVTRDPLVITNLLIVFQFIGIVAFYLSVELLYNKRVAFFATIFTIVFPWHVYFTRMIYNPSMLLWSIPLVIYMTLLIVKKGKQKLLLALPFAWLVMIQFHFVGLVVLLLSFGYIVAHHGKVTWRYFRFGLLISIIPLLPVLAFDLGHDFAFTKGVLMGNKAPPDPANDPAAAVKVVIDDTQKYMLCTDLENHIGYASSDFFASLPLAYKLFHPLYVVIFIASLLFYLVKILWKPRGDDIFVVLWFLAVTIFLIAFNLKSSNNMTITQRYFIPSFFAIGIMIGCALDATLKRIVRFVPRSWIKLPPEKLGTIALYAWSGLFLVAFMGFAITYHTLIITYKYDEPGEQGWLGVDSGPPYISGYNALKYALADAKKRGYNSFIMSDDWKIGDRYQASVHLEYIWKYVFKGNVGYTIGLPFYFICLGPPPVHVSGDPLARFGPWRVVRSNLPVDFKESMKPFSLVSPNSGMFVTIHPLTLQVRGNKICPSIICKSS